MSHETKKKFKDRNQSIIEFLHSLQVEYIVAEIRSKIYPKAKDKRYYKERVMPGKKEVIIQVGDKNKLPNIFTCKETREKLYNEVMPEYGTPLFCYRDEETKNWQYNLDRINYYSPGNHIATIVDDCPEIGVITNSRQVIKSEKVTVKLRSTGSEVELNISDIKIIL